MNKIYFPNLNGLRFIAAFLVIIHHIEQYKSILGLSSYWQTSPFINIIGKLGVILFFVLSGFLITYLLLVEEDTFKNIDVKEFYLRRILRIWPLYYLLIILAFSVFPNISILSIPNYYNLNLTISTSLLLYILFLPNLAGPFPYLTQTWSIGTEEQFYLIWPIFIKHSPRFRMIKLLSVIFVYHIITQFLSSHFSNAIPHKDIITSFWLTFNIDCMAIGGVYALIVYKKMSILKIITNKYVFITSLLIIGFCSFRGINVRFLHWEFYAIFFGIIILNLTSNAKLKNVLEINFLSYLGKISYGLYMYHTICIVAVLKLGITMNYTGNLLIWPLVFFTTIGISGLSYKYFESIFLKKKIKFSKIRTGDD